MSTQLLEIRNSLRDAIGEAEKIDVMSAAAKSEVEQILADGKMNDERESKRYATAALSLQMLPSRRAHVLAVLARLQLDAAKQLRAARSEWNARVARKRTQELDEVCSALRRFYVGDLRQLPREAAKLNVPSIRKIEDAAATTGFIHDPTPSQSLGEIEAFLAHVSRNAELIGGE